MRYVKPETLNAVKKHGLHKVAGAMLGTDELTIKEAVATLGALYFLKRAQDAKIKRGLAAYAALRGEKTAAMNPGWGPLIWQGVGPAALGAIVAGIASPHQVEDPYGDLNTQFAKDIGLGAAVGGGAGMLRGLRTAFRQNPAIGTQIAAALPKPFAF